MDGTSGGAPISRKEILAFRFPTKLWVLVNTPNKVVRWCEDGESFTVNFLNLDGYLCSPRSLFKLKTKSKFINYLTAYGFQSVTSDDCNSTSICKFKHEHFLRGRSDLVGKIVKRPGALVTIQRHGRGHVGVKQQRVVFKPPHQQYDPCYRSIRKLSKVERARLNLRMILQVQTQSFLLQQKLSEFDENAPANLVSVIELPADAFENPLDSISRFQENPEIAGFYGNASTELVMRFFDAYLPLYASTNGDGSAKPAEELPSQTEATFEPATPAPSMPYVDSDPSKCISQYQTSYPSNVQINYSVSLDSNESKEYTLNLLDEASGEMTTVEGHQLGSKMGTENEPYYENANALQPIYRNDEDAAPSNKEEDISMDQYLKFNSSAQQDDGNVENASEDAIMEEGLKTGPPNTEESNDDENFKNFFNQYRESVNLLYE